MLVRDGRGDLMLRGRTVGLAAVLVIATTAVVACRHTSSSVTFVIAEQQAHSAGAPPADGYWTPTNAVIDTIAAKLPAALAASRDPRGKAIAGRLAGYRGQYLGVVQAGQRRILGNYFCDRAAKGVDLAARWVSVSDGGECFFGFTFDPGDGSFHGLYINGDA
jgi:hypothetical protein